MWLEVSGAVDELLGQIGHALVDEVVLVGVDVVVDEVLELVRDGALVEVGERRPGRVPPMRSAQS